MATREKTIQFAFDTYTATVADKTVTNLTQRTLYIPETVIAFTSVSVDVGWMDIITASSGTITESRVGVQLGSAGYSTITDTGDITQTGENMSGLLKPYDFTSYFTTNWSGTSMTFDLQVYFDQSTGTTLGMNNVTSIVTITYTYNDDSGVNATQIKTAWIPLESLIGNLTTTPNSEIGTNQIPILTSTGAFLPEATPVIRDYAFIIGDCCFPIGSAGDWTLSVNIDSGTQFDFASIETALATDRYFRGIWRPTPPDTTVVHAFQMWASVANNAANCPITLMVTYEFDASTTTTVLNSILMPIDTASVVPSRTGTESDTGTYPKTFYIEEPTTITLKQSAVLVSYIQAANSSLLNVICGVQAVRTYTTRVGVNSSHQALQHRIDSGGASGTGITIGRGKNELLLYLQSSAVGFEFTGLSAMMVLNYHSGLASEGIGAHNHTVIKNLHSYTNTGGNIQQLNNTSFSIPETNYYLNSIGYIFNLYTASAVVGISFQIEVVAGEWKNNGYHELSNKLSYTDAENGNKRYYIPADHVYRRFPNDYDVKRLDLEAVRNIQWVTPVTNGGGIEAIATYHSITFVAADNVTGFSGTVTIGLYDATTFEKLQETSRSGDGAYSFTWYDDVEELFAEANDGTNVGRSLNGTAV